MKLFSSVHYLLRTILIATVCLCIILKDNRPHQQALNGYHNDFKWKFHKLLNIIYYSRTNWRCVHKKSANFFLWLLATGLQAILCLIIAFSFYACISVGFSLFLTYSSSPFLSNFLHIFRLLCRFNLITTLTGLLSYELTNESNTFVTLLIGRQIIIQ